MTVLLVLMVIGALACPVQAAESMSMGSAVLQMGWALLIVVGLILVIAGLARRRLAFPSSTRGQIKVLEIKPLVNKASLALIQVRGQTLLIGIGQERVTLLRGGLDTDDSPSDFDHILKDHQ